LRSSLWLFCGLMLCSLVAFADEPADVVVLGARIIDVNNEGVFFEAMALRKDRIAFVGTNKEAAKWTGSNTKVYRLGGNTVVPGFIESHGHFLDIGLVKLDLDLHATTSEEQVIDLVKKTAANASKGSWVVGDGWDQNRWASGKKNFPDYIKLSKVSPANPVVLYRVDGHALWANARALALAKITAATKDPAGGKILRFADGKPTGIFIDEAMSLISSKVPAPSAKKLAKAFKLAEQEVLAQGVTTFHDAGVGEKVIELYEDVLQEPDSHLRFYLMLDGSDKDLLNKYFKLGIRTGLYHNHLTIRAIKAYADGALGSRGAALTLPYADEPDHSGLLLTSEKELSDLSTTSLQHGFQMCTHAIGDRANHQTLNAYEQAMGAVISKVPPRFRIEHAQLLAPKDVPRFAKLTVIASMQPIHATSDMPWVATRIGEERAAERAYVWRDLLKSGAKIAAGSDAPVESVSPIRGFYAAVTRQDEMGHPQAGWFPKQRMTRLEALRAYTTAGAYAGFQERDVGSIEVGKLGDFVVLDRDILTVPEREILKTKVLKTFIGGKLVYTDERNIRHKK
jgi:predicted amidohydrolase YtcJ